MERKILVIYALNEYPTRNMIRDFLYSFKKYTKDRVIYYNRFTNKLPDYLKRIEYDAVIFHQSLTFCADRTAYVHRIQDFEKFLDGSQAVRVALFQDEYINTDMSVKFLNDLKIDHAYSVAPKDQWEKIYKGVRKECIFHWMLTGYIEKKQREYYRKKLNKKRSIDIGYRAVWNKSSITLGKFGYDKIKIANEFNKRLKPEKYRLDIKVGRQYILKGRRWTDFLSSARFILGVESGGSVLDRDGGICQQVNEAIASRPDISVKELYKNYVEREEGNFRLCAISPRHFEAIEEGTCQILYEGEYSGILKPGVHYIELKKDYSNFDEVIELINDEKQRMNIVKQAFHDIVESDRYTFKQFVKEFYNTIFTGVKIKQSGGERYEQIYIFFVAIHEMKIRLYVYIITALKKLGVMKLIKGNKITKYMLQSYYLKRI